MKLLQYNRVGPTNPTKPYGRVDTGDRHRFLGTSPTQNHQFACHGGKFDPTCAACQDMKRKGTK